MAKRQRRSEALEILLADRQPHRIRRSCAVRNRDTQVA